MGVVRFVRQRVQYDDMPAVCMRCGAQATVTRNKTFSKSQGWTFFTIFLGAWPYFLCALLFRHRLRVPVPLCDAHRNHFRWQAGVLWGGIALVALLLAGCFALMGNVSDAVLKNCFLAVGIVAAVWVVVLLGNRLLGITAGTVNDEEALVVGVSDDFAKAYEARETPAREVTAQQYRAYR